MSNASSIKYRTFGGSSLKISEIGLGCASAWGQSWFDEKKAIAVVHRAIELGVTVFDTGPSYSKGNAEPRLAKALQGVNTEALLISTKVGTHIDNKGKLFHDLTPKLIVQSVEASRQRLGLDTVPLLYLHGPRKEELGNELLDTLTELRNRGWVDRLGVNSFDTDVLEALADISAFDFVMLDYNVLRPNREPLIEKLSLSGKFIVAGAAVANHLYAPRFLWPRSFADVWYALRALKNYRGDLVRARGITALKTHDGYAPVQVALGFVLANERVGTAMFSTTRLEHLEENIAACNVELPTQLLEQIRSL